MADVQAGEWDRLRIERQVWLLCREAAEKNSRRWFDVISRIALAGQGERSSGLGVDVVNADRHARLAAMQFAATDLIPRLSAEERARVSAERQLPDWFVPEMLRQAKAIELRLR